MKPDAFQVVRNFERAIADYTGAPMVVCVNSCTMAILLAVAWHLNKSEAKELPRAQFNRSYGWGWYCGTNPAVEIPNRTYLSVPMSIIHAGGQPTFRDEAWEGAYRLKPLPVWDSARWLTSGMFGAFQVHDPNPMACVSFHATKTLGIEQGGAILLDDSEADAWLRRMRFDGRTEGVPAGQDQIREIGWHCYLNPSTAALGLLRMHALPEHNKPLPNDDYPDLSTMEIFR